jgi:BirA family biotin operon repressor/biotin-[acetyl-CoA-carboxylase] ligase
MPFHFEDIPSTQLFLKDLVGSDPMLPHLDYALSDLQSGGIARHGRSWISERGNLFLSLWLKNYDLPLTWIPHWMGVSLIGALEKERVPVDRLSLKWPNDLVLDETQKLAGILCEKVGDGIVVGIGVNLLSSPALSDRDTGCIKALAPHLDFKRFNHVLAERLILELKQEPSLEMLTHRYSALSLLKAGRELEWTDLQTQKIGSGSFLHYGKFGELLVLDAGQERALYSEEVKLKL